MSNAGDEPIVVLHKVWDDYINATRGIKDPCKLHVLTDPFGRYGFVDLGITIMENTHWSVRNLKQKARKASYINARNKKKNRHGKH